MKHENFEWKEVAVSYHQCDWNGLTLTAGNNGRWFVYSDSMDVLSSYETQAPGEAIEDAKHRAQSAAMALQKCL